MTLLDLLRQGLEAVGGSQRALAVALGLSESYVSRLLKGTEQSMGVGPCLRLARLTELDPSEVLTLAGKQRDAELIQEFFGSPIELSPSERRLLDKARALGGADRVMAMIATLESTLAHPGTIPDGQTLERRSKSAKRKRSA